MGTNFTLEQLAAIGIIASALVVFFRFLLELAMKQKFVVPDWVMILIVYLASFAVAVWWFPAALPSLPVFDATNPASWLPIALSYAGNLLIALTGYATAAGAVYAILLQKVKDGLGRAIMPAVYGEPVKK